jgi:hypothetical protein
MNKDSEIAFTKDIAELVAEELGISKEKVLSHIDFMAHWIKTITEDPENLNVYIPHVGYMYLNVSKVQKDYDHFSNLEPDKMKPSWVSKLDNQRVRLDKFNKQFPNLDSYNRHKKKSKFTNNWFNKGMTLQQLEEWQNK